MKKFLLFISSLAILTGISMFAVLSLANGHSDPFYLKISSSEKTNLILGTSKPAQGIHPTILNNALNKEFYNFSFTMHSSPFGKAYLKAIKEKLDTTVADQTFIITIDIWGLGIAKKDIKEHDFRENTSFLNQLNSVNANPNIDYLMNHFSGNYYELFKTSSPATLHENGWLEVAIDENKSKVEQRRKFTLLDYQKKVSEFRFSELRLAYLIETIDYLKQYGKVYLVRLPVHQELFNIEEQIAENQFNQLANKAISHAHGYLDLSPQNHKHQYTDGVHLNVKSGADISRQMANWIKN